jgi:hypothetical protein
VKVERLHLRRKSRSQRSYRCHFYWQATTGSSAKADSKSARITVIVSSSVASALSGNLDLSTRLLGIVGTPLDVLSQRRPFYPAGLLLS